MPNRKLIVFLCHAKEDKPTVRELYRQLTAEGWLDVWLDEENLFPGQEWDMEIEKAVEQADVVVVCLSTHSVDKEGYVQKELRFVLNIADEKPEGTIFVVPLRLDDCQVPRRIRTWQYVDYFPKGQQKWAYQRLLESLKMRAVKLGISIDKSAPVLPVIPVEDEFAKVERERKAREERERLAAQKLRMDHDAKEKKVLEEKNEERTLKKEITEINKKPNSKQFDPVATFTKIPKSVKQFLIVMGIIILIPVCITVGSDYVFSTLFPPVTTTPTLTLSPATLSSTVSPTYTLTPDTEPPLVVGSKWISPKDGMTMMFIPAGEFKMGSENGASDEKPIHDVYLDSYWMDQTEVTNKMYSLCVNDGICKRPDPTHSYGYTEYGYKNYYHYSEFDNYPVVYVDWDMARTYCEWTGARLPTEAEWEKAARGTDGRTYPWGEEIDCVNANYTNCGIGIITAVGSYEYGKSPYGLFDMAGNVWEWVMDWYDSNYYSISPLRNPQGPIGGGFRVLRGGSGFNLDTLVRSANREPDSPHYTNSNVGFRCSRSLP